MRSLVFLAILVGPPLIALTAPIPAHADEPPDRPNILWITSEDNGPHLGSYGLDHANTPALDRLAERGVRYTHAFATSGVCAPARSAIITGMYPSSLGTEHMRSTGNLPDYVRPFPAYLREAGYYCTNNAKEDYNFAAPDAAWDESSGSAHYSNREPGQPFFHVVNFHETHESRIRFPDDQYANVTRRLSDDERQDPDAVEVPPYHPDTPEVRRDWANQHELMTALDYRVAEVLDQLEEDGLADDTIVFYYSDHGDGMPRSKRWLYDGGLHVPLIVHFPEKWRHLAPSEPGTATDRLVSFVDFGPTVLSLAGVEPPEHMHGRPFLGEHEAEPRDHIFGLRGRMDERYDMQRAVRDDRYLYIANYMPHKPYAQHIGYMYEMPTMRIWHEMYQAGELDEVQRAFFEPKPNEELYDTRADPHQVVNLAEEPEHQELLQRMRRAHWHWMAETRDLGLLPEPELHTRFGDTPPHEAVRDDEGVYPLARLLDAAIVARQGPIARDRMLIDLEDDDSAVRYWAALGLVAMGGDAAPAADELAAALEDDSPTVRVLAAHALIQLGDQDRPLSVLGDHLDHENDYVALWAANVLDELGDTARPHLDLMRRVRDADDTNDYVVRVLDHAVENLDAR